MYFSLLGNIGLFNSCVWCMWNRPASAFFLSWGHGWWRTLPVLISPVRGVAGDPITLDSNGPACLFTYTLLPSLANCSFACWAVSLWIKWKGGKAAQLVSQDRVLDGGVRVPGTDIPELICWGHVLHLLEKFTFYPCLSFYGEKKNELIQITLYVMCPLVCSRCEPLASGPRRPHPPISDIGQRLFQPLGVPPQSSLQGHTNAGSLRFV